MLSQSRTPRQDPDSAALPRPYLAARFHTFYNNLSRNSHGMKMIRKTTTRAFQSEAHDEALFPILQTPAWRCGNAFRIKSLRHLES